MHTILQSRHEVTWHHLPRQQSMTTLVTYISTALSELVRQSCSLIAGSSIICGIALSSCSSQGCHGKPDCRENLGHCSEVLDDMMWGLGCRLDADEELVIRCDVLCSRTIEGSERPFKLSWYVSNALGLQKDVVYRLNDCRSIRGRRFSRWRGLSRPMNLPTILRHWSGGMDSPFFFLQSPTFQDQL